MDWSKYKYFKEEEFKCKCGECDIIEMSEELLDVLTDVREHFNAPVSIVSGYRCEAHNKAVGGAKNSKHKLGIASDIKVSGIAPNVVYKYLDRLYPDKYGMSNYPTFVHIDVRDTKARWGTKL